MGRSPDQADALLLCFVDLGTGPSGYATPDDIAARIAEQAGQPLALSGRIEVAGFGYGMR